jgi:hypothetical protein
MRKILNTYIKRPILWDIIVTALGCYIYSLCISRFCINLNYDIELIKSIISDLISTSISLAGFVLASLTIIVTFKDNISNKQKPDEVNGIELLFSSKHYGRIVGVFTWAVFMFLLLFLLLALSKLFISKVPQVIAIYFCLIPISIITLTIFRSILVLYSIIRLQLKK